MTRSLHELDLPAAAVIGGGFIGPVHVEALRRNGIEVRGLLGGSIERARTLARRLGIPRVYASLDELLGDDAVGAVHVASPNAAHAEQAQRVLEASKHVICEKPLGISARETARLLETARARPGLAAAVNYNVRYYPLCLEMRERVRSGEIGRVLAVTGSYVQDWLLEPTDYNWRVESDGQTNLRAAADVGTHWMDLAQSILGQRIEEVCADLLTVHPRRMKPLGPSDTFGGSGAKGGAAAVEVTTDDYAAVMLRFAEGARGLFHVSQVTAGRKNRLWIEISGSRGSLAWDSDAANQLWIGSRQGASRLLERDPSLLSPAAAAFSDYPGGHPEGFPETFKQLHRDIYTWIAARDPARAVTFPSFADGDQEARICEAIAQSARTHAWATVAPAAPEPSPPAPARTQTP